ncbi:MAG: hypothetical protein M1299_08695 [Firmicutes bacterium]|nr:hypothetical protein [Bacillota bacterium]MCL5039883.1 hypothetical protein [Bacillota bacterium]
MQLNIYIPKDRARILEVIDEVASRTKRPKNDIILEVLERYLPELTPSELGKFSLGKVDNLSRDKLYGGRLKV